jgi:hypothetical protein
VLLGELGELGVDSGSDRIQASVYFFRGFLARQVHVCDQLD